jgi:hypothetical protein
MRRLFQRSDWWLDRNEDRDFRWLIGPFEYQMLRVTLDRVPKADRSRSFNGNRSESGEHLAMKSAAEAWLRARGAKEVRHEAKMHGGRADVFSPDLGVVVECGDTRVGKLYAAILDPEITSFSLIPYQHTRTQYVVATFTWDPEVAVYVNDERRKFMREATDRLPTPAWAGED